MEVLFKLLALWLRPKVRERVGFLKYFWYSYKIHREGGMCLAVELRTRFSFHLGLVSRMYRFTSELIFTPGLEHSNASLKLQRVFHLATHLCN